MPDGDTRLYNTGLSENEAKEVHGLFMTSFFIFTAVAIVAHFLVWMWRPWFPGVNGYASLSDTMTSAQSIVTALI